MDTMNFQKIKGKRVFGGIQFFGTVLTNSVFRGEL